MACKSIILLGKGVADRVCVCVCTGFGREFDELVNFREKLQLLESRGAALYQ